MEINLSGHFTYKKLIRFTIPTIAMMIFTSIYGVVDGLFISNIVGTDVFAAVNLIMPAIMILGTIGFMLGTGGSAIVSKTLGEGDNKKANHYFSMFIYLEVLLGFVFMILGLRYIEPIANLLGADETMLEDCLIYGKILLLGIIPYILQNSFQSFIVVAEKPKFGLMVTVAAGVTNMVLDYFFIHKWGVAGAAIATIISQFVGAIIPLVYFFSKNDTPLRLGKTKFEFTPIIDACINGSSEMVTNLSLSLVSILFNKQLMELAKADGVSAYGVIMYIGFLFVGTYVGYSVGTAPIISYHYGAKNKEEVKSLLKKSVRLLGVAALVMTFLAEILAKPLASIFIRENPELLEFTVNAIMLYSLSYIISWFNIFASSFFTALNDGVISAIISFARTLVFQVITILLMPRAWGIDGVWLSVAVAEILALGISLICFIENKRKYEYV